MLRSLEDLANATPKDYLSHVPKDIEHIALGMISLANQKWPIINRDDGRERIQNHSFYFVGPGAGLVVKSLIEMEQSAQGCESSRRGIQFGGPEETRAYIKWSKPWETPFPTKSNPTGGTPVAKPIFHVGIINGYLKQILTPEEWSETIKETKKLCRYAAVYKE